LVDDDDSADDRKMEHMDAPAGETVTEDRKMEHMNTPAGRNGHF
jgi:hypothetical protein